MGKQQGRVTPERGARRRGPLAQGLRRLWWLPLGGIVLCAGLGVLWSLTQPAQYSSTAQVVVKGFDNLTSQLNAGAAALQDPNKTVATLRRLVKVDEVVNGVATDVGLSTTRARDIASHTAVETQVDSDLIGITVTWGDRTLSQRMAQAFADEFVRYRANLDTAPLIAAQQGIRDRISALAGSGDHAYLQQLQNAEIDLRTRIAIGSRNSEVASRASDSIQVAPRPTRSAILGGIAGLALSLFAVALLQAGDSRVRSEVQAARALGAPTAGVIPRPRGQGTGARLAMLESPGSPAAEPFRVLATNMRLAGAGQSRHTIMVAPAEAEPATALLAANVAAATARAGRLSVVCDLDLRRPQVGPIFGLTHALGAGDVLSGSAGLDDALHHVPMDDSPDSGLWIMPAGEVAGTPADLAGSVRMGELIQALHRQFEVVLVCVPPWTAVADALAIGQHVDAVLPVVPSGVERRSLLAMRRGLQQLGAHVLGIAYIDARARETASETYGPLADEPVATAPAALPLLSRIAALLGLGRG